MKIEDRKFFTGLARAFAGAIFFALPMLMTMEMWFLGFYIDSARLALFMAFMLPLLIGLDRFSGFMKTSGWWEDVIDALVAYAVGFAASAAVLLLFNLIDFAMPLREVVGKVALQAVPASFGAVLANSQLSGDEDARKDEEEKIERGGYPAELLFMLAGAVFLAFNLAPTEEMILLAFIMTPSHVVALALASILVMHGFVYAASFKGTPEHHPDMPQWSLFLRFSIVGYVIALMVSAYVLWTFGRFHEQELAMTIMQTVVLGFPAAIGAAGARLVL